jgi:DNA-binding HxlR family transcriptional regulator
MANTRAIHREEEVIEISAGKWTILVVRRLGDGKQRFNELRRQLDGISQKTLTTTLRGLERDGFVERTFFPTIPPRVEYELTGPGVELLEMTNAWGEFIRRHHDYIESARRRFFETNGH